MVETNKFGIYGDARFEIEFALYAMPQQVDPNNFVESNRLLSLFFDRVVGSLSIPLIDIGISPFGKLLVNHSLTYAAESASGQIVSDGVFRTLSIDVSGSGAGVCSLDGNVFAMSSAGFPTFLSSTSPTMLMLFNDKDAFSRLDAAIRRVRIVDAGAEALYEWKFNEGDGPDVLLAPIDPDIGFAHHLAGSGTGDLQANYYNPLSGLLYGPVPDTNPAEAYNWQLRTDYRRRVKTPTSYRHRRTAWPV
jgi:hypothetical protein